MATSFRLGGGLVPVIEHVNLTGQPTQHPSVASSRFSGYSNDVLWALGNAYGAASNPARPAGPGTNNIIIGGGRTGINDSTEVIFSIYDGTEAYVPGVYSDVVIARQEGTSPPTSLDGTQYLTIAVGFSGSTASAYDRVGTLVAIEYSFPDADTDAGKRNGYVIACVERELIYTASGQYGGTNYNRRAAFIWIDIPYLNTRLDLDLNYEGSPLPDEDPNEEDPDFPSEPSEPEPDHTIIINPIVIPSLPTMGSATAGFLTMYKLSLSTIQQFAADMFASSIWEAIKLFFTNPMDFLVGCMLLPFEPSTGSSYYPKFGIFTFEHSYPAVDNQYKEIDCGYVDVKKFWGSCFDFEPFTKLQIWLPYIGYRDIPTDEFMGEQLHVVYHCDCLTGDCVAFISTTGTPAGGSGPGVVRVLAQYYGNCGVRVPFSSVNFDAAVAAGINLMGAAASIGLSPGSGGAPAMQKGEGGKAYEGIVAPQDVGLIGASMNVVTSMKPTVQKGGAAGASNGYMSIQKPYLIKRIPHQNLPQGYAKHKGYPSNIGGTLSQFSGYAEVGDIQLNNIPAMEDERKEIMNWLSGGVLI